jgi:hypothetical protein
VPADTGEREWWARFALPTLRLLARDALPHSRGAICVRALHQPCPSENRGRREDRVFCAPAASYAVKERIRVSHHRSAETIRPSLRDGINAYFRALPGVRDLIVSVACDTSRRLSASPGAPGPHDFVVRFQHHSSVDVANVHRNPPRVRDDAYAPLSSRDGVNEARFSEKRKQNLEARPRSEHYVEYAHEIRFFVSTVSPSKNDATPQNTTDLALVGQISLNGPCARGMTGACTPCTH